MMGRIDWLSCGDNLVTLWCEDEDAYELRFEYRGETWRVRVLNEGCIDGSRDNVKMTTDPFWREYRVIGFVEIDERDVKRILEDARQLVEFEMA